MWISIEFRGKKEWKEEKKKVTCYEPDDEDDCLFVGEGESGEEQGDSVLFGSQLRSEKAKKDRFGSSVDGPGGLFGERYGGWG